MFLLSFLLLVISLAKSEIQNVTVKSLSGTVVGNSYYLNGVEIKRFLGIPFATPPLGQLRFLSPLPVEPWSKPLIAQTLPAACIQYYPYNYPWVDKESNQSEDCLYLNIWAPKKKPCKKAKKAVMFWIFSGGFSSGSNREPVYDGQVLAAYGDVIVVTVNYRVQILGFLYAPTEYAPGNMGLLDVLTALQWVNNNIETFGGDKNRITVFGQSAGSITSALLTMAPLAKGLFQRVILESGSPLILTGTSKKHNVDLNLKVSNALGCDVVLFVDCLKKQDAKNLTKLVNSFNPSSIITYLPITGDKFLPVDPEVALKTSAFENVDVLAGVVQDEGSIDMVAAFPELFGPYGEKDPKINKTLGRQLILNMLDSMPYKNKIADHYLSDVDEYDYETVRKRAFNSVGDLRLTCPTVYLLESFSQKKSKTYMYYFNRHTWNTDFAPWMGVTHFTEVQFVFGRPLDNPYEYSPAEVELSKQMMKMWTEFSKKGVPSANWKQYSKPKPYIHDFYIKGVDQSSTLNEHLKNCDFLRPYRLSF